MAVVVSVLMIAYNNVRFIEAAINSVKRQSFKNWELVISDDCSADGTWDLIIELSGTDERIKIHRNDANIGVVKNRKQAFEFSSGRFICHLDGDDMLERYALEEMLIAFYTNKKAALIYSDIAQIGENGYHQLYSPALDFDAQKLHQHGWRHFGMYRREVMDYIDGYNDKLISACEDGDLFMQIAEKYLCVRLPKALYMYRVHSSNASSHNKKCSECSERPVCNYMRVWSKSANYDPITFTPLQVLG